MIHVTQIVKLYCLSVNTFDPVVFHRYIYEWIIGTDQPFIVTESPLLRQAFIHANKNATLVCKDTIRRSLMKSFRENRTHLSNKLVVSAWILVRVPTFINLAYNVHQTPLGIEL